MNNNDDKFMEVIIKYIRKLKTYQACLIALYIIGITVYVISKMVRAIYYFISEHYVLLILGVIIITVIVIIVVWLKKPPPKPCQRLPRHRLDYNSNFGERLLHGIMQPRIAAALNLVKPEYYNDLRNHIRWTFINDIAKYKYLLFIANIDEGIAIDVIKNTIQTRIEQALLNGEVDDGIKASCVLYGDLAMPRIYVHSVEQIGNRVEISIVYVNHEYAKMYREGMIGDINKSLDNRIIEDEDV